MVTSITDQSKHRVAKVAGFAFIFAIAIVIFSNYSVNFRFIISDNAVDTAHNIMAHETLFRINIVSNLIYLITLVVMFTSLYVILKRVNKNLALVAVFFRLLYALMWGFMAINTLAAIRLLGDASYLSVFEANQLQTLSRLHLSNSWDAYYVGLPFWGLASAVCSFLFYKSKYIPGALAIFGFVSSVWCIFCGFAFLIFPDFGEIVNLYLFDMPLVFFEMTLGFWLLFKGLKPVEVAHPNLVNL